MAHFPVRLLHIGDIGTLIRVLIAKDEDGQPLNISAATVKTIKLHKPSGVVVTHAGTFSTDGTDGRLQYETVNAADIDEAGPWQGEAYIEIGAKKWHTTKFPFEVDAPF